MQRVQLAQAFDEDSQKIIEAIREDTQRDLDFTLNVGGVLMFRDLLCVPNDAQLRKEVLTEAYDSPYSIHPGSAKVYRDLKGHYFWSGMKTDVARYGATMYAGELFLMVVKPSHKIIDFSMGLPVEKRFFNREWEKFVDGDFTDYPPSTSPKSEEYRRKHPMSCHIDTSLLDEVIIKVGKLFEIMEHTP
ncbi:uncharacterized protein LOC122638887 [Telopea speciosissima]|uniref:uncharacterized protein LOC122638887 n=1 Tax=Telopea speciosissima TaxID=54955 RepID=UPI001CC5101C|nr:uncharacterized protein LOC122638887 [Telopea speciosissima]